ncbi:hypothetical protein KIPB_002311 [Kipferlia bialata]|uniref:DUF7886 domain-containing protein n=1 Tax=Kipferlia bialata TaxID=797122 RepID=A0A9K3CQ02_9EUKA|nr:hypothetical protein KIPB_002311 [Kipferlia bialata]|eukprot:g2311.t1
MTPLLGVQKDMANIAALHVFKHFDCNLRSREELVIRMTLPPGGVFSTGSLTTAPNGLQPASPRARETARPSHPAHEAIFLLGAYSKYKSLAVWSRSDLANIDPNRALDLPTTSRPPTTVTAHSTVSLVLCDLVSALHGSEVFGLAVDMPRVRALPRRERQLAAGAAAHYMTRLLASGDDTLTVRWRSEMIEAVRDLTQVYLQAGGEY